MVTTAVNYSLDEAGNLTSDGLRNFDYDPANRLSKARVFKDGEEASIRYLHNALGQRVFKGEPQASQTLPNEAELGTSFIDWLKSNFKWLFAQAQANTSIGTGYVYGDAEIPSWAVLGDYDNGSAKGAGRSEYIWLPTEDGQAIPVGMYRNGKFFAIHTDHLGTPRLMTSEDNKPVWQWPYSAFGNNKPTGMLKATPNPKAAITNVPVLLKATGATELNLRFPGQYDDAETGTFYNYFRSYCPACGRYTQSDPMGMAGGLNRIGYVGGNPLNRTDPTGQFAIVIPYIPAIITGADLAIGAGLGLLRYGLDRMFNEAEPPRGLPPEGVKPPIPEADECKAGPASRPSERDKGGQSLWDPNGGEWRWFPGDKWHNPHWDYNAHDGKSSPWTNVPHDGLPPVKK